jgi:hypothetical protein
MLSWEEFKGISADEWMQKAIADLKGKVQPDQLQSHFGGELDIRPFLTGDLTSTKPPIAGSSARPALFVAVSDEKSDNIKILDALHRGTEALWLNCIHEADMDKLLAGVYPDMIYTLIHASEPSVFKSIEAQITTKFERYLIDSHMVLTGDAVSSEVVFITHNQTLQERLENFVSKCLPAGRQGRKVFLNVDLKSDFLTQISELRAFRQLWSAASLNEDNITIFSGISDHHAHQTEQHAMIPVSYLILSAQFGMSHYVLDGLSDQYSEYSRLLLQAQHIFHYESGIDRVEDPFAGSYVIEKLTEMIVSKVQTLLQKNNNF